MGKRGTEQLKQKLCLLHAPHAPQKIKIFQINLNKCRTANDLALASVKEINSGILLLRNPSRKAIADRRDWISD